MRLRRASLVMLSVILVFVLAACGGGNNTANSGKTRAQKSPRPLQRMRRRKKQQHRMTEHLIIPSR